MINEFKCVTSSSNVLGKIEIQDYMNRIKYGDENLDNIKEAREFYFDNELKYVNIKRNLLPCFTLNFTFNELRKNNKIIGNTGYIYIDIDGTTDIDFNNPLIYATWVSLSGYGRGTLVRIDNLTYNNFSHNYELISNELGVKSDKGAKKATQVNVLSYDPNIYINTNSNIWLAKDKPFDNLEKTHYSRNLKNNNIIGTVMGSSDEPIRYDNLDNLIDEVEFNGDVIYDFKTKVKYSKVSIPWNSIPVGKRNTTLTGIAFQFRAFNPSVEKSHLFRYINKINRDKCYELLPINEVTSIVNSIMKIEDISPIENAERRFLFNKDYELSTKQKRQEVMKVLNSDRIKNSKMNIESTIADWDFDLDGKITQKGLANKIPMNIKTVKKYYSLFKTKIQVLNTEYQSNKKNIKNE